MRRREDDSTRVKQRLDDRTSNRRALRRVGTRARLVEDDDGMATALARRIGVGERALA